MLRLCTAYDRPLASRVQRELARADLLPKKALLDLRPVLGLLQYETKLDAVVKLMSTLFFFVSSTLSGEMQ